MGLVKSVWQGVQFASIGVAVSSLRVCSDEWADRYLLSSLNSLPGLPRKASQFLSMNVRADASDKAVLPKAMSLAQVKQIIQKQSPALANAILEIEEEAKVASLAQVHRAYLKDGREVAIKIQFPEIRERIYSQIDMFFSLGEMGPAKKYGFDFEAYKSFVSKHLSNELSYNVEANRQKKFKNAFKDYSFIVIPEVIEDLSTDTILVQSFESSQTLEQISHFDVKTRQSFAEKLSHFVLLSIFKVKLLHTDLQPGNIGFRPDQNELVIYDFGSTIDISLSQAESLQKLIQVSQHANASQCMRLFLSLGFDQKKLSFVANLLPKLTKNIFAPFVDDKLWYSADWRVQQNIEEVLNENRWWFRSSGPPWFLFLMRSVHAWHYAVNVLDVSLPLRRIYLNTVGDNLTFYFEKEVPEFIETAEALGKILNVSVYEDNEEIVSVQMPVRSVDDLENIISDDTRKHIESTGCDLRMIREQVQKNKYAPQNLIDTKINNKTYKVWIS